MALNGKRGALVSIEEAPEKKQKLNKTSLVVSGETGKLVETTVGQAPARTSSLEAPTMMLTGHKGAVYSCKFNPSGTVIASASADKTVFLWNVQGDCKNFGVLRGFQGAVLGLEWFQDESYLLCASADKKGCVYDVEAGARVKTLKGHTSFVNSVNGARRGDPALVTASDDSHVNLWDMRIKGATTSLKGDFPVLSAVFSDDSTQVFSAGIDEQIKCWDLRNEKVLYKLTGHKDVVTGMELSPDGRFLLSNAMDNSLISWDVRPFVSTERLTRRFGGHRHNMDKTLLKCNWSPDGTKISAGSADRFVYLWDAIDGRIIYKLPGHAGSVNEVDFHPTEPVIVSGSNDKKLFLGEIAI